MPIARAEQLELTCMDDRCQKGSRSLLEAGRCPHPLQGPTNALAAGAAMPATPSSPPHPPPSVFHPSLRRLCVLLSHGRDCARRGRQRADKRQNRNPSGCSSCSSGYAAVVRFGTPPPALVLFPIELIVRVACSSFDRGLCVGGCASGSVRGRFNVSGGTAGTIALSGVVLLNSVRNLQEVALKGLLTRHPYHIGEVLPSSASSERTVLRIGSSALPLNSRRSGPVNACG